MNAEDQVTRWAAQSSPVWGPPITLMWQQMPNLQSLLGTEWGEVSSPQTGAVHLPMPSSVGWVSSQARRGDIIHLGNLRVSLSSQVVGLHPRGSFVGKRKMGEPVKGRGRCGLEIQTEARPFTSKGEVGVQGEQMSIARIWIGRGGALVFFFIPVPQNTVFHQMELSEHLELH